MIRVAHYLNQFFGGIGGEEEAGAAPSLREGPVGPGAGLAKLFGDDAVIAGTLIAGDNYMAQNEAGSAEVVDLLATLDADVLVAGPGFGSGRYGLACGAVCARATEVLGIPSVTALYADSPGAEQYRSDVLIVPTKETAAGMGTALPELARIARKLAAGEVIDNRVAEGLLSRGLRGNVWAEKRGSSRAIDMLLAKASGESFVTEWPLPKYDRVEPAAPSSRDAGIKVALVTEAGIVPKGNPDRIPSGWAKQWFKYSLADVDDLLENLFESVHGGIDTTAVNADPDRQVPVDVVRMMANENLVELHEYLYSTTGNMGSLPEMRRIGSEIARELVNEGVQAVIVGST